MTAQMEMFAPVTERSTSVRGLIVNLPSACSCGAVVAAIGSSAGPHHASLRCAACNRHRGWVSGETFSFIAGIIDAFGRPREPIEVRFRNSRASADIAL